MAGAIASDTAAGISNACGALPLKAGVTACALRVATTVTPSAVRGALFPDARYGCVRASLLAALLPVTTLYHRRRPLQALRCAWDGDQ
jgi:hypothetical protein